jgi:selenocysteine lyase/cysteine desulfurase
MADTREMFSLPAGVHYLNHAYMSPLSKKVVAAGRAAMDRLTRPWEIGAADFFRDGNLIRERFSRLVNAPQPDRVALIPASSYGLAQVARNTELHSGQNVVMVTEEFPSNRYVWRRRCETAAAELRETGRGSGRDATWTTGVLEAIDADTAVVTLSSVHWCDGSSLDLEAIGARAREVGAAFVVDGTQSVGAIPFDLQVIRPDALVCASYKWLTGPYSIGVVWLGERYSDGIPIEET